MNITEHLMQCLQEEAGEIIVHSSKGNRFGNDDGYPGSSTTNAEDVAKEIQELIAVKEMLESNGIIPKLTNEQAQEIRDNKKARVVEWMDYAKQRNTLS